MHINLQSKFQVQTYENVELMRIIALLVDELGGKFTFTREVIEKMLDAKGELRIDNDFPTMSTIITYRDNTYKKDDIGNTE